MNYKLEEIKPGLERIGLLCDALSRRYGINGKIQDSMPAIHIAGTNGKGSVGKMLTAIYEAAGFKVGHFSSPAVFEYEEMFYAGGQNIDENCLKELFAEIDSVSGAMSDKPSPFERECAAAFLFFYKEKCDICIYECGMGGLLDATNVINKKLASVITSIGMDHMGFLGDTAEKIAKNKAGIISPGSICVIGAGCDAVEEVLTREAELKNNQIAYACDVLRHDESYEIMSDCRVIQKFKYKFYDISLPLAGICQLDNAITALETIDAIADKYPKYAVDIKTVEAAMADMYMPGRLECIKESPYIYIDGAHNEAAWLSLKESIKMYFTNSRLIFIIGVLADKAYEVMARELALMADKIFTITPPDVRALPAGSLAEAIKPYNSQVMQTASINEALLRAGEEAADDSKSVIIAFGSLSFLKEIKQNV